MSREAAAQTVLTDVARVAADGFLTSEGLRGQEGLQGLSWSWDLDFEALLAAINEPAPWNSPPREAAESAHRADASVAAEEGAQAGPSSSAPTADRPASTAGADGVPAASDSAASDSAASDSAVSDGLASGDAGVGEGAGAAGADLGEADPAEADQAELMEAIEAGRARELPLAVIAGRIAESLPTGPDLAGWLAVGPVSQLEDGALAGVAASYRRMAAWAQAGELAAVAEMASRSAAADDKIGVDAGGRPARMPDEACAQVALALTMSQCGASWWTDLGITLTWRLAATGTALRAGEIDLPRARLIAEATALLSDDVARAVEARVLSAAGHQTTAQLRAALRRAVIAADPEGAERRRQEAERRAKVSLYPDEEGTASLAGYSLPGTRAAAAMARISALARAMKASGASGGIDLLRAQVFLGLLLGTLPYIPPAPDSPSDGSCPDGPDSGPGSGGTGSGGSSPDGPRSDDSRAGDPRISDPRTGCSSGGQPDGPSARPATGRAGDSRGPANDAGLAGRGPGGEGADEPDSGDRGIDQEADDPGPSGPSPDYDCGLDNEPPSGIGLHSSDDDDDGWSDLRPAPAWPEVTAFLRPAPPAMGGLQPSSGGLLDLTLPWTALAGDSTEPGYLSRIGPITPVQARHLADLAASDATVQWRVILTSPVGRALTVARIPQLVRAGPAEMIGPPGFPRGDPDSSLIGRVTLTVSEEALSRPPPQPLPAILTLALDVAARAAARAAEQAVADAIADGGCAHTEASLGYRPSPRLKERVSARDVTCRFPTCRQPVWRCDLDHSIPYDQGGRTCACNLGGLCRFHHQLKQHPDWQLTQLTPGQFQWTTPTGRTYATGPDSHSI